MLKTFSMNLITEIGHTMTSNEMVYYLKHETNFDLSILMEIANHIE